jgi:hypothetical protein
VRDKIVASKRKGLWVGGPVPLGYRCVDKKLEIVPEEAEAVGTIFSLYLGLGSMELADIAACDTVLTSLPDDNALAAVALGPEGLAGILAPHAVHVSTSTVSPDLSRRVAEGPNDAADEFWRFKSQFFPHFLYIRFDGCQLEHLFGGNETRPQ